MLGPQLLVDFELLAQLQFLDSKSLLFSELTQLDPEEWLECLRHVSSDYEAGSGTDLQRRPGS